MLKSKVVDKIEEYLLITLLSSIGVCAIIFASLYVDVFNDSVLHRFKELTLSLIVSIITLLTLISIIFLKNNNKAVFKLTFTFLFFISVGLIIIYILKNSGIIDKFSSVAELQEFIEDFKGYAIFALLTIQFLQVIILPIPSMVTVMVSVILFGYFFGAIISTIGIVLGSIVAFAIGRRLGIKVIKYIFGESKVDKLLVKIEGKDKKFLCLVFILPLFPDDLICFLAGVTKIKIREFLFIVSVARFISVFFSSLIFGGIIYKNFNFISILIISIIVIFAVIIFIFQNRNRKKTRQHKTLVKH